MVDGFPSVIRDKLAVYEELLVNWQRAKNLVSPSTFADLWDRHFLDSYQLIRLRSGNQPDRWLDIGSGAGLPGMVLAIAEVYRDDGKPCGSVTLVEANSRKCAFMRAVSRETQAPVTILNERIEALKIDSLPESPTVITARALAPLPKLCSLMFPLMAQDTVALVHKGQDFVVELEKTAKIWNFDVLQHNSVVDDASVILEISNLKKR